MENPERSKKPTVDPTVRDDVVQIIDEMVTTWRVGRRPSLEEYLARVSEATEAVILEIICTDMRLRHEAGDEVRSTDYLGRFPSLARTLEGFFDSNGRLIDPEFTDRDGSPRSTEGETTDFGLATGPTLAAPASLHRKIGRYVIRKVIGEGSFGRVYLGFDEDLERFVAIKVPRAERISRPEDLRAYVEEARTLARLDHPRIVPVLEVGRTEDGLCFVVSKYIAGGDLTEALKRGAFPANRAAELIADLANALDYSHSRDIVHRDIKPANILLDESGKPYLADFGLALKDEDYGKGSRYAGTPAYMSPEQARSESHRVDGRSDIFSIGVLFYELLTGKRPFRGETNSIILENIAEAEPRPPRQFNDSIPKELERICLKALSKRVVDRYTTGRDMEEDLRVFLKSPDAQQTSEVASSRSTPSVIPELSSSVGNSGRPDSFSKPLRIVPKGLRSFDHHDADFYLELLHGPRDRDGLPDSIRFWKIKIEERDLDQSFRVGLIYGPSGCGKSSMMKAGLLPRLSSDIIAVHIEATADVTEIRMLNALRKKCAGLPERISLKEAIASIRLGRGIADGKKILIILDQFEQWLHARKEDRNSELVQALRQCDGVRVQCIVMVRDDFWMAATRFMKDLEIRLVEDENSAAVDLFPVHHAEKVLRAFGRAFAVLPEGHAVLHEDHEKFIKEAVSDLAKDGKVISVRLALFAEMMKDKPWTPASLQEVGGTEGVGVAFLEETFGSTAALDHRYHQQAAREVLRALLPESGTDIKGHMRSHADLLEVSGYAKRVKDFDDLIRILNGELRLITPTDPEGQQSLDGLAPHDQREQLYFQLTHDYLVPSLREWLTRKEKETRRGRAELLLADRAAIWTARMENRQLPSLGQWISILWHTRKSKWTLSQKKMMRRAATYHTLRSLGIGSTLVIAITIGMQLRGWWHAQALAKSLLTAETSAVPAIIIEMSEYQAWVTPLLKQEFVDAPENSKRKLHVSLALLPSDSTQVAYLVERLLQASPADLPVVREALLPYRDRLLERLWQVVEADEKGGKSRRLRAASALAKYDAASPRWGKAGSLVVNDLVQENPIFLGNWSEAFRPVKQWMLDPLSEFFRDRRQDRATERILASNLLADYAADRPDVLADLIMDADEKQFAILYPKITGSSEIAARLFRGEIEQDLSSLTDDSAKERQAKRQANSAVALLRLGRPEDVWPLLKHSPDPRVRSYIIHRFGPLGASPKEIIKRLEVEADVTIRQAMILGLGEFVEAEFEPSDRESLTLLLQQIYRDASDSGLHASAEWVLSLWKQQAWLEQMNQQWSKERIEREAVAREAFANEKSHSGSRWYVNGQGQTMIVIPGPSTFQMGSPLAEASREDEVQHLRRIDRTFALAAKPVTLREYQRHKRDYGGGLLMNSRRAADLPVSEIDWNSAAIYCNWLSEQEGIAKDQWCYEIEGDKPKTKPNHLKLIGYRLPTEAEMEYATRAGASTARYYGETDELLGKYAWYQKNSDVRTWPVGTLKPNDFGLFDTLGNVFTWCQDKYRPYPKPIGTTDDLANQEEDVSSDFRVMRGGSFISGPLGARSAARNYGVPSDRDNSVGFRPARTITDQPR